MNASKFFLKAANSLVTAIVALFLILAAAYSGYALWDNAQVYGAVDDIQSQLLKLKPDPNRKTEALLLKSSARSIRMSVDGSHWTTQRSTIRFFREKIT